MSPNSKVEASADIMETQKVKIDIKRFINKDVKDFLLSDIFRTGVAIIFGICGMFVAAFTTAVANDRLPDKAKYPPLPDLILEHIPYMSFAFDYSENCITILSLTLITVTIFHKNRIVVIRRVMAIVGHLYFLRSLTIIITSLSVPTPHTVCNRTNHLTFSNRSKKAIEIISGFGLAKNQASPACGDYMFSGHTFILTIYSLFIVEYTPKKWRVLHMFCWLVNILGIFFVLASHEHYSVDVVIGFYVSSRLFFSYHTLASSVHVREKDENRRTLWYPLFSYFEYKTPLVIKNEFEWPFTRTHIDFSDE